MKADRIRPLPAEYRGDHPSTHYSYAFLRDIHLHFPPMLFGQTCKDNPDKTISEKPSLEDSPIAWGMWVVHYAGYSQLTLLGFTQKEQSDMSLLAVQERGPFVLTLTTGSVLRFEQLEHMYTHIGEQARAAALIKHIKQVEQQSQKPDAVRKRRSRVGSTLLPGVANKASS